MNAHLCNVWPKSGHKSVEHCHLKYISTQLRVSHKQRQLKRPIHNVHYKPGNWNLDTLHKHILYSSKKHLKTVLNVANKKL